MPFEKIENYFELHRTTLIACRYVIWLFAYYYLSKNEWKLGKRWKKLLKNDFQCFIKPKQRRMSWIRVYVSYVAWWSWWLGRRNSFNARNFTSHTALLSSTEKRLLKRTVSINFYSGLQAERSSTGGREKFAIDSVHLNSLIIDGGFSSRWTLSTFTNRWIK